MLKNRALEFYFWWFLDPDILCCMQLLTFFYIFGFISHFLLFFSLGYYSQLFWVFTPFVHFFCGFVAEAFYISILISIYSTWRVNIDGYFFCDFVAEAFYISLQYLCLYKNPL